MRRAARSVLAVAWCLVAPGVALAQPVDAELQATFERASELFPTGQYQQAIDGFGEVVDELERRAQLAPLTDDERSLLLDSLTYRARATANEIDLESATPDLRRLIELDPEYRLDLTVVSPRLAEIFAELQRELVGQLYVEVFPPDATMSVDGRPVTSPATLSLLTGNHVVLAERPGHAPMREDVALAGGDQLRLTATLERTSAVLKIVTRPAGASISIDGMPAGVTRGSEALPIAVATGVHQIAVTLDGYRVYRSEVPVKDRVDYNMAPIILEPAAGSLSFRDLPPDAVVTVNERPVDAALAADGTLTLPPGDYFVRVAAGGRGVFERDVALEDGARIDVPVRLRPTVAYLGALNDDRIGDAPVREAIDGIFGPAVDDVFDPAPDDGWLLVDRSPAARGLLPQAGLDTARLGQLAETGRLDESAAEWRTLQELAERDSASSAYVFGVLSDTVFADHVDLWIWRPAPHPARPDLIRIPLEAGRTPVVPEDVTGAVQVRRAWLGARLIDSDAASGPVVVSVDPEGPAAGAGLEVGDVLVTVGAASTRTVREVLDVVQVSPPGSTLDVGLTRNGAPSAVTLTVGTSPEVMPLQDPQFVYSLMSARLEQLLGESTPDDGQEWALRVNEAVSYFHLRAWDEATLALQEVVAPPGPGLGQGAVDYWLGIALSALGPGYRGSAREAFERAAADPAARLYHHDGPLVAPRARARLRRLGVQP